jgi:hypothetical protein
VQSLRYNIFSSPLQHFYTILANAAFSSMLYGFHRTINSHSGEPVMTKNFDFETFNMGTPARYRIRVLGGIDTGWHDRLGGMTIRTSEGPSSRRVTTLSGKLLDQAALAGVLDTLYQLSLPLLSLENLDEPMS